MRLHYQWRFKRTILYYLNGITLTYNKINNLVIIKDKNIDNKLILRPLYEEEISLEFEDSKELKRFLKEWNGKVVEERREEKKRELDIIDYSIIDSDEIDYELSE